MPHPPGLILGILKQTVSATGCHCQDASPHCGPETQSLRTPSGSGAKIKPVSFMAGVCHSDRKGR